MVEEVVEEVRGREMRGRLKKLKEVEKGEEVGGLL